MPEPINESAGKDIPGPKILLMGDSGTGKTTSLKTLIDAGITPYVLFLEQGMESITDLPPGSFHYVYISPLTASFNQLIAMAKLVTSVSYENLTKAQDNQRSQNVAFMNAVTACNDFKCDCCGKSWGNTTKWETDRALCIDGMSGLSDMAMAMTTGLKPTRGQHEWGVAMNMVKFFVQTCTTTLKCTFVLITHTEREKDEITGGTTITLKTLGVKLAPEIPQKFSDVIMAERIGTKFTWSTASSNSVTKTRNLEIAGNLPPNFGPVVEGWKRKGGKIVATT